jgi:hypothetical protein
MLATDHIAQIAADQTTVYVFRIDGGVTAGEMSAMADVMNAAFDRDEKVSMLLILSDFGAGDAISGVNPNSLYSQMRSLSHVERYAVVGAPSVAAGMINAFDKVLPIEARTFDAEDEASAWEFVGARPLV